MKVRAGSTTKLNPRERAVLIHLVRHSPTTYRETCDAVGLRSTSTLHQYVLRLERHGLLTRRRQKSRTLSAGDGLLVSEKGALLRVVWISD